MRSCMTIGSRGVRPTKAGGHGCLDGRREREPAESIAGVFFRPVGGGLLRLPYAIEHL